MNNPTNTFKSKIAVATNDQRRVTGHIGRCRSFMIYEIDGEKIIGKELRENNFTNHRRDGEYHHSHGEGGEHKHTHLIEGLKDCKYLISSGGGWRVVEDLKLHNISTLFTDVEMIEDAVNMFVKGELKNESNLVCDHNH